jgi:hypothetical protein
VKSPDEILQALSAALEGDSRVHAAWLEGSRAEQLADQYSDYDLWLDVDDGAEDDVYAEIEGVLTSLGRLDLRFEMPVRHPQLRHITYHIAGTDPFHRFEVNIQSHSRAFKFVEGVHFIRVLFDKDGTIVFEDAYEVPDLRGTADFLRQKFDAGLLWVERELQRGNYLDAYYAYELWLLRPLIELIRIRHTPSKTEFGLKHSHRDFPEEVRRRIEDLYRNSSLDDIQENVARATQLRQEF